MESHPDGTKWPSSHRCLGTHGAPAEPGPRGEGRAGVSKANDMVLWRFRVLGVSSGQVAKRTGQLTSANDTVLSASFEQ